MDNAAAAIGRDQRHGRVAGPHARHDVDLNAGHPSGLIVGPTKAGCVADQNIGAANGIVCGVDIGIQLIFVSQIASSTVHGAAMLAQVGYGFFDALGSARADRDRRSFLGKSLGNRQTYAAAATCNDGAFSGEG